MRILYVNFIYDTWGHISLDQNQIKLLSKIAEVTVIARTGWYTNLPESVRLINFNPKHWKSRRLEYYANSIQVMKYVQDINKQKNFDYIFAATFDIITMFLLYKRFDKSTKLYLMHHNNVDLLTRKLYLKTFQTYMNNVNHIVQAEFIRAYLHNTIGIPEDKIKMIPHPYNIDLNYEEKDKIFDCVGISNSNDEKFINELIELENMRHFFKLNKLNGVFRSKNRVFHNGYLNVISGYLPPEKYKYYINSAKCIIIPFSTDFQYRMSGTLIDALSNNIPVIGREIPIVKEYAQRYPEICFVFKDISTLLQQLKQLQQSNPQKMRADFHKFRQEHSDIFIQTLLKEEFANI